jgi:NADH-quinone oxidoreductase subunit J
MAIGTIIVFGIMGLVVVASAVGMLISRNAVYAAMFLVLNFLTVGFMYLSLGAAFIALAQVTVYAGSIMVLFLFVIMLLGGEQLPFIDALRGQRLVGVLIGIAFLAEIVLYVVMRGDPGGSIRLTGGTFATPASIGMLLFNRYLLPFEITSVLLLAAVIGAIFLTRGAKAPKGEPAQLGKE